MIKIIAILIAAIFGKHIHTFDKWETDNLKLMQHRKCKKCNLIEKRIISFEGW